MSQRKMDNFVSFPLFRLTLVIQLRNFDFESYGNTLIFFDKNINLYLIVSCQIVSNLI